MLLSDIAEEGPKEAQRAHSPYGGGKDEDKE